MQPPAHHSTAGRPSWTAVRPPSTGSQGPLRLASRPLVERLLLSSSRPSAVARGRSHRGWGRLPPRGRGTRIRWPTGLRERCAIGSLDTAEIPRAGKRGRAAPAAARSPPHCRRPRAPRRMFGICPRSPAVGCLGDTASRPATRPAPQWPSGADACRRSLQRAHPCDCLPDQRHVASRAAPSSVPSAPSGAPFPTHIPSSAQKNLDDEKKTQSALHSKSAPLTYTALVSPGAVRLPVAHGALTRAGPAHHGPAPPAELRGQQGSYLIFFASLPRRPRPAPTSLERDSRPAVTHGRCRCSCICLFERRGACRPCRPDRGRRGQARRPSQARAQGGR